MRLNRAVLPWLAFAVFAMLALSWYGLGPARGALPAPWLAARGRVLPLPLLLAIAGAGLAKPLLLVTCGIGGIAWLLVQAGIDGQPALGWGALV